jgi:hypothetical protein
VTDAPPDDASPVYLIDGFNLLHAVILRGRDRARWWSGGRQRDVVSFVTGIAEKMSRGERGPSIPQFEVVFDAAREDSERFDSSPTAPGALVGVVFAPSADDFIVARVLSLRSGTSRERPVWVVTADRPLADRARHRGAERLSPWQFAALGRPR